MPARDYALGQLDLKHLPGWPAETLNARRFARHLAEPPDARDRALAEQIVLGVVKNHLHLKLLIGHFAGRSLRSIDPLVQKILSMALYQLRFLTKIPPSAAVNEAVEQARRFGLARAAGFANAVLRKATAGTEPALPDPKTDPAGYAELVLSHPRELFGRLARRFGTHDALRICEHNNARPPTIVRLIPPGRVEDLPSEGVTITPHEMAGMLVIEGAAVAMLADWAHRGIAQVQDPAAARVVGHMQLAPGQTVLDRCCGLGTKTLQMHEAIACGTSGPPPCGEDRGRGGTLHVGWILAMDPSEPRCRTLRLLLKRRGISNIIVRQVGMLADLPPEDPRTFDRVLVDAPCSNSGVLARRAEARYAQDAQSLGSLVALQDRILDDTAAAVRSGGHLVYSTCSIWEEENEQRVQRFLQKHEGFRLIEQGLLLPSLEADPRRYHDGGYLAALTRDGG